MAASTSSSKPQTSNGLFDDFGFDTPSLAPTAAPVPTKSPQPPPADDDDWGLGDFASAAPAAAPPPSNKQSKAPRGDLLGLDDFLSGAPSQASDSPGDFDFGNREDGLLNNQSDGEDDILGDLGKPV